ncbi:MAG: hypothetical protein WA303_22310 [Bradyrhizobium sp.]|jgi:hypothetical protein
MELFLTRVWAAASLRNLTRRPAFCFFEVKPCGMNEVDEFGTAVLAIAFAAAMLAAGGL